ncbi:hypothetical protein ACFWXH_10530 [Mesorhizobium sp. NPDC059054]|uniref:hypothetical protein n=1 Tax=Mesorhizobium sp. NPDC059054 TaxID=3346711 RepID=UPI0036BF912C
MSTDEKFTFRLSPLTRLMMTLDEEMALDRQRVVFDGQRREMYLNMYSLAVGKRDQLLKSVALLDTVLLLLLYGKSITVPGLGITLLDIPAGLEIVTVLASLTFMFLGLAFLNEQAYLAIANKFGQHLAKAPGVDPDFVNASEKPFEFVLKLYGRKMNIGGPDFFVPGLAYRLFFGSILLALQFSMIAVILLHFLAIGAACTTLWSTPSAYYFSQVAAVFALTSNVVGFLIVTSMNIGFSFTFEPVDRSSPR